MDERVLFVADWLRGEAAMSTLCRRYGVSRKTGYKWVGRYDAEGLDGLEARSRRPHGHPHRLPHAVRQAILELRGGRRDPLGPKKIQAKLAIRFPDLTPPSRTTIYKVLKQAGCVTPRRRRRGVAPHPDPLRSSSEPNGLWSADFKGQFLLRDGHWCYPLTVMDHASRYLLGCQGLPGTGHEGTRAVFEQLFRRYGLPDRLRTDNGVPFATRGAGGLSRLCVWLVRLGVLPERIAAGQPQQNGRHERMHRTLKRAVAHPPEADAPRQQRRLNSFRRTYNTQRPHEALGQQTPRSRYRLSPRPFPDKLPELHYPSYIEPQRVMQSGVVYCHSLHVYVGYLLHGQDVGFEAVDDRIWDVHFGPLRIGRVNAQRPQHKSERYYTLEKCYPCS